MFINISWMDYGLVILLIGSLYYLFVGLRYYPSELKELLSGKRKQVVFNRNREIDEAISQVNAHKEDDSVLHATNEKIHEVESLIAALKERMTSASKEQHSPEEFINSLKMLLRDYSQIQDLPFRTGINELILSECEKHGTITLSEDDVVQLWEGAV